ncbi:hypothetical protein CAC42_7850 [Sphaceloma murrayae]|uniref:Peptidase M14 domain-containing protein n=1 Tax=Sphaceloma murrayae TaxID=2082308 RepID=A0A2K1QY91_9PEZI|nr:hypothetical protein CAC42_7850 [Sphaceloma murrayae]
MKLFSAGLLLAAITTCEAAIQGNKVSYDGWQVLRVKANEGLAKLHDKLSSIAFDDWAEEATHLDIAVPPTELSAFKNLKLEHECLHENLGHSIAAESEVKNIYKRQVDDLSWFDSYHPYAEHQAYWDDLQRSFPNSKKISSGTSYEGRDIFGLHLWGDSGPGKPAVLWHGTVHAREWISNMVVEYLTLQLINGYKGNDTLVRSLLDRYDFFILPFVNPDGFVYSQEVERLWRKNRQPGGGNSTCFGRDINRQWPFQWDGNPGGASPDPCSQVYRGDAPSDGPESQGLVAFVNNLRDTVGIKLFIDWHSYGQYIMFPYGYNCTVIPEDAGELTSMAALTSTAIRNVNGVTFTYGPACPVLYATTGGSRDYVYAEGKADWSYTIELRDTGNFGFVLPPDQIRPAAAEQWQGQRTMLRLLDEVFFDGRGPA